MSVGHGFLSKELFLYYNSSVHNLSNNFQCYHTSHSYYQLASTLPIIDSYDLDNNNIPYKSRHKIVFLTSTCFLSSTITHL